MCLKPNAWRCAASTADEPPLGLFWPLLRLENYSAVSMRLRWRPVRTRVRQSGPKVPEVGPKGHFWGASASLFDAKVAQCCMCEKHTIYYVFTTLSRVRALCFRLPANLRNFVVTQFVLFPSFSAAWSPKGAQSGAKASQSRPKSTPK